MSQKPVSSSSRSGTIRSGEKSLSSSPRAGARSRRSPFLPVEASNWSVARPFSSLDRDLVTSGKTLFFLGSRPCHQWQDPFLPWIETLSPVTGPLSSLDQAVATSGDEGFSILKRSSATTPQETGRGMKSTPRSPRRGESPAALGGRQVPRLPLWPCLIEIRQRFPSMRSRRPLASGVPRAIWRMRSMGGYVGQLSDIGYVGQFVGLPARVAH